MDGCTPQDAAEMRTEDAEGVLVLAQAGMDPLDRHRCDLRRRFPYTILPSSSLNTII